MAGEKYGDKAVANLLAYYETNLPTYLTAVETDQGLASGSMTPPVDYVPAHVPHDTRSPILQMYCTGGEVVERDATGGRIYGYNCVVLVDYVADADPEALQLFTRRYMTALIDTVRADHTLGGTTRAGAIENEQDFNAESAGDSETRRAISLSITVLIDEPA